MCHPIDGDSWPMGLWTHGPIDHSFKYTSRGSGIDEKPYAGISKRVGVD